jgi:hypothetical protein
VRQVLGQFLSQGEHLVIKHLPQPEVQRAGKAEIRVKNRPTTSSIIARASSVRICRRCLDVCIGRSTTNLKQRTHLAGLARLTPLFAIGRMESHSAAPCESYAADMTRCPRNRVALLNFPSEAASNSPQQHSYRARRRTVIATAWNQGRGAQISRSSSSHGDSCI